MGRLESGCHSGASGRTFALGIEDALSAAVRGDTGRALAGRSAPFTIDLFVLLRFKGKQPPGRDGLGVGAFS